MTKQAFVFSTEDRHECVFVEGSGELHREIRRIVREWEPSPDLKGERKPEWDKYHDTGVPKQEQARAGYYVECDNCDAEVVFDEWFEIDDGVYCYGCTEKYLTKHLSQCQCGGRPIAYISDWGNVEIECPECETRLICGEGDVQDYLEDWGNMGITQVNQKGEQDIGQHCKQD